MSPSQDEIVYLSAGELLAAFRARELSPVEVLDAVEARADVVEPVVNAFAERLRESARRAAHEAEQRYGGGGEPRPLEGVPVAVKEEQPIAGLPLRSGSLLDDAGPEPVSHPVVERILAAGAVVHARTTTPEFSCAGFTHSKLWGVTRNPWQSDYTPGGSSGGSGAALAAGTAYLATGSDIAGSIRMPASFCGVVGFKPPYGRVPGMAPFSFDNYCHDGPMARTVADCALLEDLLAGPHPSDLVTVPAGAPLVGTLDDRGPLRVAYAPVVGDYPVHPDVRANSDRAAQALREAGVGVDEIELPIARADVMTAAMCHYGAIFGAYIAAEAGLDDPRLTPYAKDFARRSVAVFDEIGFYRGLELEARVHSALAAVFAEFDALLCPTMITDGWVAGDDYVDHGVTVDGVDLDFYLESALTPIFNIASRSPVLSVPSGRAGNGVPTGVQLAGRPFCDAVVFQLGSLLESQLGLWSDPAWRPAFPPIQQLSRAESP